MNIITRWRERRYLQAEVKRIAANFDVLERFMADMHTNGSVAEALEAYWKARPLDLDNRL